MIAGKMKTNDLMSTLIQVLNLQILLFFLSIFYSKYKI